MKTVMRKIFGRKRRSQADERDSTIMEQQQWTPEHPSPESPFVTVASSIRPGEYETPPLPKKDVSAKDASFAGNTKDTERPTNSTTASNGPRYLEYRQPRRRATLPSIVLSARESRELANALSQHSSKASSLPSPTTDNRDNLASMSKKHASMRYKRRSRSASDLREVARDHRMSPIQWRRRSDEIRPCRSSNLDSRVSPTTSVCDKNRSKSASPAVAADQQPTTETLGNDDINEPVDDGSFHFGTLLGAGDDSEASLVQRVGTLEVKLMDLEFAIAKLQGSQFSPMQSGGSGSRVRQQSQGQEAPVFRDPPPFISSFNSTPSSTPSQNSPVEPDRPQSTVTLRPQASRYLSPSTDFSGISVEQYSALTTLVRREQSARKHLEEQLLQLQRDVAQLRGVQETATPGSFLLQNSESHGSLNRRGIRPMFSLSDISVESGDPRGLTSGERNEKQHSYLRSNLNTSQRTQIAGVT